MSVAPSQLARTLVERHQREQVAHAQRAAEIRQRLLDVVPTLGVKRAWLIGSLANGLWGAASDVDVVVEGLAPDALAAAWARLEDVLRHRVDLLAIEELPPPFVARVLREGVSLV